MTKYILTDGNGKPFDKPTRPEGTATVDEHIAFIRKMHAYNDAITDLANRTFDTALRPTLRGD